MIRVNGLFCLLLFAMAAEGKIYNCIDGNGQRIFVDRPCTETMMGTGTLSSYSEGVLQVKQVPVVLDDEMANKIRLRMTPSQVREKYCAKYSQVERDRLVQTKQVLLGMYLSDVIKVWGAPLAADGNKVLFQDKDDKVTVSLLEGCVINIDRNYIEDDEFYNPQYYEEPIEDTLSY